MLLPYQRVFFLHVWSSACELRLAPALERLRQMRWAGNVPGSGGCPGPGWPRSVRLKSGCQLPRQDNGSIGRWLRTKALLSGMILYAHMWPLPGMALWKVSLSGSSAFKCRTLGRLLNLSFFPPSLFFCHGCLRRGHVQITRWCWAFSHHLIELFSNGQGYFLHFAKSFTGICYLECFFCF